MHEELLMSKPPKENVKQKQNVKHTEKKVYACITVGNTTEITKQCTSPGAGKPKPSGE